MIILSDCLTDIIDEGGIKVANTLTQRIKQLYPDTTIISYKQNNTIADKYMDLNPLFFNIDLFKELKKSKDSVLYIPFSSNTSASILRTLVLTLMARGRISVIFVLQKPVNIVFKYILRFSKANIIALSRSSYVFFKQICGMHTKYLKTGIDTQKFIPVSPEKKRELRTKYDIPQNIPVVFHAGHLKSGRNIDKLIDISSNYFILLAISSVTLHEQDLSIRQALEKRPNTKIIDTYVENIQELYQLSDYYVFPVTESCNCIDVPLSVLEAASCNLPVITTPYGELREFKKQQGFFFMKNVSADLIESILNKINGRFFNTRHAVLDYDWQNSANTLISLMQDEYL